MLLSILSHSLLKRIAGNDLLLIMHVFRKFGLLRSNGPKAWLQTDYDYKRRVNCRGIHHALGDVVVNGEISGIEKMRDPRLNKGLAFTLQERQALGIHGLIPGAMRTMDEQLELCKLSVDRYQEPLNKYIYLTELAERNEKLYFRLLSEYVEELMPVVYTPTVGLACLKFGIISNHPRGLFITIHDRGHIQDVVNNWPEPNVRAIVVTDGERILGLGDLGSSGMGIPIGKLALYTALAGIRPHQCLPIQLDVGTNNEKFLQDPTYIGLRQRRTSGAEYDAFVDEFMVAITARYGQNALIQFEDFGIHNAFRFLEKYRNQYCTFNDDIQGTASVVAAGLMACKHITRKEIKDNTYVFLGAGGAALGIANLLVLDMEMKGVKTKEAQSKIWMMDINGLITSDRTDLDGPAKMFAKDHRPTKNLKEVIDDVKPSVLIGASTQGGAFTAEILQTMAANNERPVIFALSNPTIKAECTAEQAYQHTEGRCVFSSGSPFPPVTYNGKTYKTGQGNNAYIFPGVALGVIFTGTYHIQEEIFLIAAQTIAENVPEANIKIGCVYPNLSDIKEISLQIATEIAKYTYEKGYASIYPEPKDKRAYIQARQYNFHYWPSLNPEYSWPTIPPPIAVKPMGPAFV